MNYALDGILVLVVLVFVLIGVRRGFVRSAAHFLGAVLAALLAAALGGMAAQWLFDSFFRQSLVEKVQETISTLGGGDVGVALVVSLTLLVTVVLSKLLGCVLPVVASSFGLDPAVMASPLITTISDALSLVVYFRIAALLLAV